VFKPIAEQVLAYLNVPRDVPLNPRLMQAAYKQRGQVDPSSLDDLPPTDFSSQPDQLLAESNEAAPAEAKQQPLSETTMAVDEGGDVNVPDFSGKTMRDVTEMFLQLGLEPLFVGSGLATDQTPAAGTQVKRGARVTVQFGTLPPEKPQKQQKPAKSHRNTKK
jgi:hypothetical protein